MRSCSRWAGVGGAALLRRRLGQADLPGRAGRVRREATAEQQAEHDSRRRRQAAGTPCLVARRLHGGLQFAATNSICSGRLASIRGPLRTSIQPRTRRRRFSSAFGREPGAREDALLTFRYGDRERLRPSAAEIHIYGAAAARGPTTLCLRRPRNDPVRRPDPSNPPPPLWHIAARPTGQSWRSGPHAPVRAALRRTRDRRPRRPSGRGRGPAWRGRPNAAARRR